MSKVYGYCRISTKTQDIERQKRNIKKFYPEALLIEETYTGTTVNGRPKLTNLCKNVKEGDVIVFDSVSRMSRNAEEGMQLYETLYKRGIDLVFLKEPYINTKVFKEDSDKKIKLTGTEEVDIILDAVNKSRLIIAKNQIKIAFEQSEKEVNDLRQRTKEGMLTAKLDGKRIGLEKGAKLVTQKSIEAKKKIMELSCDFNGSLADIDVMNRIGIARNTYYKYKRELREVAPTLQPIESQGLLDGLLDGLD